MGAGRSFRLGDANLNGAVDGSDFGIWNSHKFTLGGGWCGGDFSADGIVDGTDFGLWNANKFTASDSSLSTTILPLLLEGSHGKSDIPLLRKRKDVPWNWVIDEESD